MKIRRVSLKASGIILVIGFLFVSVLSIKSQTGNYALTPERLLPQFSVMTPEAASLGHYGSYDVSEYSGSANIKIPLFTITSGDVKIPVELYYDASGIKVNQDATFVGLGWNLSYGGCVNHIVCGHDDFREYPNNNPDYFMDYYSNHSIPSNEPCQYFYQYSDYMSSVATGNEITLCLPVPDSRPFLLHYDMSRGYYTPDVFQASFCGHHLSFIIDKRDSSRVVILNNDARKYKIEYEMGITYPSTFWITDDKGITYKFQAFKEFDNEDAYYLTQIYGADGAMGRSCITFEYDTSTVYRPADSRRDTRTINSIAKYLDGDYPNDSEFAIQMNSLMGTQVHYSNMSGESGVCRKVYPKKITTALETIEFALQNREDLSGAKAISGITVKSKNNEVLDHISLTYGYFAEVSSPYTSKRLKLNSVSVNSKIYQLSYDEASLPSFLSFSQDYWGYYNGASNGQNLCGTPKFELEGNRARTIDYLGEANRYASETLCKVGMLNRITYPTGGYTVFAYEANRFTDKYYYPEVNKSFISTPTMVSDFIVSIQGGYGPRSDIKTFSLQEGNNFRLQISLSAQSNDSSIVILRNTTTGTIVREASISNGNALSQTYDFALSPGSYSLEARIHVSGTGYSTVAYYNLSHEENIIPQSEMLSAQAKGGISIGGGLRIKSIKNYDSSTTGNKYLSGIEYEYRDGKLLIPTLRLEKHYIDFSYISDYGHGTQFYPCFTFAYACSDPTYMDICSVGVPATVGYSTVIKKEVNESGQILRRTELEFHNYGYEMNEQINQVFNNAFYYCTNGHLNGRLKCEKVYVGNGNNPQYRADYSYDRLREGSVLYPNCIATFLPNLFWGNVKFHFGFYRKFIDWCYLTQKSETIYDINGYSPTNKVTAFIYNESNYQPSMKTVSNGVQTEQTRFWYPSDSGNQSTGLSYLLNKNYLSEITGIDIYRNNVYTRGSRYSYTLTNNSLPVVNSCQSKYPSGTVVLQMQVNGYDDAGNIREYQKKDGTPVTVVWSYNYQHPVLEIVGKTYSQVLSAASSVSQLGVLSSPSYSTVKTIYNSIRQGLPDAHVTAYLYSPWHSVSRIILPNGQETFYNYDGDGRLMEAGDLSGTQQKYYYNYKNH